MPPTITRTAPLVPAAASRRLVLAGSGLLDDPTRRATPAAVYRLVERLGFVQVDSIHVVERAHHLILAARLDGYRPAHLTRLIELDRRLFEHWTHDAAVIPSAWFPHWHLRFAGNRTVIASNAWWQRRLGADHENAAQAVLERIRNEGPLLSKDFEHDRQGEPGGWWGWKPQKTILEYLWHTGVLGVTRRVHFQKVYDLMERVLPDAAAAPAPAAAESRNWACRTALERLGLATAGEIASFWQLVPLAGVKAWCAEAAARGEIVPVRAATEDGSRPRPAWALPDWERRAARAPRPPARIRLLAPFDPLVWDRRRTRAFFGFDYVFEAFTPAPRRKYGYYVLPVLEGGRLIGRADPERDGGTLRLRRVFWEPGVRATAERRRELDAAVARLAACIGLDAGRPRRAAARRVKTAAPARRAP